MKIVLVCAAGMSTSLLVNNMKKYANADDVIDAFPISDLESIIQQYDVILVGPQVRYEWDKVERMTKAHGKKAALIDMMVYGQMDGKAVYEMAVSMYK